MKKVLGVVAAVIVVVGIAAYAFREPLLAAMFERMTADMFVARDDDPYDPGLAMGTQVPTLHARYQGREVTQLDDFMGSKGLLLLVNRSVDW